MARIVSQVPENALTVQKLRSLQHDFDVTVVAFYRRPAPWLLSMYRQERKKHMYDSRTSKFRG